MKRLSILPIILALLLLLSSYAFAGSTLTYPKFKASTSTGVPLSGGKVYTYKAGTSTSKATYSDKLLTTPNANPTILDSNGEASMYLTGAAYKIVLKDSNDVTIWTIDNVTGTGGYANFTSLADYGNDLSAAVDAIGSTQTTLLIDSAITLTVDKTIPATMSLLFAGAGSVSVNTGKTLTLNTTSIDAGNFNIFKGAGSFAFATGTKLKSSWFADFGTAITKISTAIVSLEVTKAETISSNVTTNANTVLRWNSQNILTIANGYTLTFPSGFKHIESDNFKIFDGTGSVSGLSYTKVKWFGAVGLGDGTDDRAAIQKAIDSSNMYTTLTLDQGTYDIAGAIDLKGRKLNIIGNLRATSTFARRTMSDSTPNISAMIYIGGNSGATDGARVVGMHNLSSFDIDCSDSGGTARAEFGILINTTHHINITDLLIRRATVANVAIAGNGFSQHFERIYSSNSPYGFLVAYDLDSFTGAATGITTGSQGNMVFTACYAPSCGTGFYFYNAFNTVLNACAADTCALALRLRNNARIVANGFNSEGSREFIENDYGSIIVNQGLVTYLGTANQVATDTYAGLTAGAGSSSDYRAVDMSYASVTLNSVMVTDTTSSNLDNFFYMQQNNVNKLFLKDNWIYGAGHPRKGLTVNAANGGFGSTFATGNLIKDDDFSSEYRDNLFTNARFYARSRASQTNTGNQITVSNISSGVCTTSNTEALTIDKIVKFSGDATVNGKYFRVTAITANTNFTINDTTINPGAVAATTCYEQIQSFTGANTYAPDTLTKATTMYLYLEPLFSANNRITGIPALKCHPTAQYDFIEQRFDCPEKLNKIVGRTITFSAWVKESTSDAKLAIYNGSTYSYSSAHSGSGLWELLSVTTTILSNATLARFQITNISVSKPEFYIDSPQVVLGDSCGNGEISYKKGEIITFESPISLNSFAGSSLSTATYIDFAAQSQGRMTMMNAVYLNVEAQNTGAGQYIIMYGGSPNTLGPKLFANVANVINAVSGRLPTTQGQGYYSPSNGNFSNVLIQVSGIETM